MSIGKTILRSICSNSWCKIDYVNKNGKSTKYMIGINFIDSSKKLFKYGESYFSNSIICSHIGKDTKYNEPIGLFWHFYHELGMELDSKVRLRKIIEMNNKMDVLTILDKYPILKNEYINHKISFLSHCTKGPLQITFYFKFNDNTKKWLSEFENDYKLELPLQDLAFYKDDKIRFSSCTHERFHSNIK